MALLFRFGLLVECSITTFAMLIPCSHWIWSSGGEAPAIAASQRLRDLTSSLPPEDSAPSLIVLVGCRRRPPACRRSKRIATGICLDFHNDSEFPLLLGTAILHEPRKSTIPCCRPTMEMSLPACTSQTQADAAIYSQLLYPFVDVFCFYAYSFDDLESIAKHLALLVKTGRPTPRLDHPPRILIALAGHRWAGREGAIERDFDTLLGESALNDYFSEVAFLGLPDADHRKASSLLIDHAQSVRRERREASRLFSVKHLNALFNRALDTVSSFPYTSFDCLSAARQDFPVDPDMAIHLENFISQISAASQLRTFAAPVVASSILLDQYLPEMHCRCPKPLHPNQC